MNKEPETLERHTRKCSICRHPDRDAIEDEFLHWHRVIWIAQEFHIPDHRSIYRHARAVGLIKARRENLHSALDNIVEQSDGIRASASDVLRAIRAYSCLDPSTGRWTEPRKEVAMTYTIAPHRAVAGTGPGNANLPIGGASATGQRLAREGGPMPNRGTDNPVCAPATEDSAAEEAFAGPISLAERHPSVFNDDTTDPSSPNYIAQGPPPGNLIGPPVIRIAANSLKTKGGRRL